LAKDIPFIFFEECLEAFYVMKEALITTPFIQPPNWVFPLKLRVVLVIMRLGWFWGNEEARSLM